MPENFANKFQSTLSAGVTSGALTGTVTSVVGIPAVPFRAIISAEGANSDEIVLVTGQAGTTLTWTRAAEAIAGVQAASAHGIGATLTAIVTAAGLFNAGGRVNVRAYGAKGDGVTDDTAAITAAIAAMPGAGQTLFFPAGNYLTSGGFTIGANSSIEGEGSGGSGGTAESTSTSYVSRVTCTSATAVLFTVTADIARFTKLSLHNSHATPIAGAAITVAGTKANQRVDYEGIAVQNFWIGVDVQVGVGWVMHACTVTRSRKYGVKVQNTRWVDNSDFTISDCQIVNFPQDPWSADAGIRIESGGGGRIANTRIHGYGFTGGGAGFVIGLDLAVGPGVVTGELFVTNTQIVGMSSFGFRGSYQNSSSYWARIIFSACLFGTFDTSLTTVPAVSVSWTGSGSGWDYLTFTGCEFVTLATPSVPAIVLSGVRHVIVSTAALVGFTNYFTADVNSSDVRLITSGANPFIGPVDPRLAGSGGATHTSANRALVCYFRVDAPVIVSGGTLQISAQSGNIDIGIYNSTTRVGSSGTTACPAVGIRTIAFTAPIQLWPGILYGLALAADNTTLGYIRQSGNPIFASLAQGGFFADTSFPLPPTITPIGVNALMPVVTLA